VHKAYNRFLYFLPTYNVFTKVWRELLLGGVNFKLESRPFPAGPFTPHLLLFQLVIRCLFGDNNVVDMALFEAGGRYAHELSFRL
jgi:hypothetical protein